jgi:tRNA A37 threonylcarbamoyladenosine dehydratase
MDPTKIDIVDLAKTWNDPLAAKVRSMLRTKYGYTNNTKRSFGIACVFSTEQQRYPKEDGSVCVSKPGVKGVKLDCNLGFGSSSCVTASFGFAAAARVLQKIIELYKKEFNKNKET